MSLFLSACDGEPVPGLPVDEGAIDSTVITRTDAAQIEDTWGELDLHLDKKNTYGTEMMITGIADILPGQEIHPPHAHEDEEFLYIAKGSGAWTVNDKQFVANEGDLLYALPWDLHGVKNTGSETLTFYFFRWNSRGIPAPTEKEARFLDIQRLFKTIATGITARESAEHIEGDWGKGDLHLNEVKTFGTEKMVTGTIELLPGKEIHPPHAHEEEEFIYIVQGSGSWTLNDSTSDARQGDLLYAKPGDLHGVLNTGDEPLIFYFMKWNNRGVELPASGDNH